MFRFLVSCLTVSGVAVGIWAAPAPVNKIEPMTPIELKDFGNSKLKENLHSDRFENNNLATLPKGKQKFGDVTYNVGETLLQLGSSSVMKPEKIEGIKVGRLADKLHFLQASGYQGEANQVVAKWIIRYEDKTSVEMEVVYGKHIVDWWAYPNQAAPTDAKAVWEGENDASQSYEAKLKLYQQVWENPHPKKKILTLDFVTTAKEKTTCAPFCVAITAEIK